MLKINKSSNLILKALGVYDNAIGRSEDGRTNEMIRNLFRSKNLKNNKSESLTSFSNIKAIKRPIFLTSNTKKAFS